MIFNVVMMPRPIVNVVILY